MSFSKPHEFHAAFLLCGLPLGRDFGSKHVYRTAHPGCIYISNACIYTKDGVKRWGGDIDLATDDSRSLVRVSRLLDRKLFVLREQVYANRDKLPQRLLTTDAVITVWQGNAATTKYYDRVFG